MSYEVLARKLRPSGFSALVGQDHVVRALTHALDHDRLHHAYLFTGTRGVGKTTIARILAKSLNCERGVSSTPCGECSICLEVKENRFIDLIEVDAASRTGVDDTRDLLENAQYMPSRGRFKVYLIDEVHMLSIASFNALLKTLEEPPEHVKFLLATTDPKKVPVTVLSRCLQFQLKNITAQTITDYIAGVLGDESVTFETQAIEVIARSARGSMRDALSLTDQAIAFGQGKLLHDDVIAMLGVVGRDEIAALMEGLQDGSAPRLLELTAELAERNADFADVLSGLIETLHSAAVSRATTNDTGVFLADELQLYYQIALVGLRDLPIAPDPRSGFEMTLLRMLAFTPEREQTNQGGGSGGVPPREPAAETSSADTEAFSSSQESDAGSQASVEKDRAKSTAEPAEESGEDSAIDKSIEIALKSGTVPDSSSTETTAPIAAAGSDAERWYAMVNQLSLGGVAKMIAEHSIPSSFSESAITLLLSGEHDTLLNDAQVQNLQRGLSELVGKNISVRVEVGEPTSETPSQRKMRLRAERQAEAEAAMREDATVQSLLEDFDGKLEEVHLH
jgi:DNA polymerase-3 subunit gamma/tau